jgi:hypothetical protein
LFDFPEDPDVRALVIAVGKLGFNAYSLSESLV